MKLFFVLFTLFFNGLFHLCYGTSFFYHFLSKRNDPAHTDRQWNITSVPRSIFPFLHNANHSHVIPQGVDPDKRVEHLLQISATRNDNEPILYTSNAIDSAPQFPPILSLALKLFNLDRVAVDLQSGLNTEATCSACKIGVSYFHYLINSGKSTPKIIHILANYCKTFHIQTPRVCDGILQRLGVELITVLRKTDMTATQVCGFIMGGDCGDSEPMPRHEWDVQFPSVLKPAPKDIPIPKANAHAFKVLQLSDTHYDPHYSEGSNANCNEPLCCRDTSGPPKKPEDAAGKWGDYRKCDTPKRTVDHMMQHISTTHSDIDYILWTGDLPPHDIWNQTRVDNIELLKENVKQMAKAFPGIPIFPALGNHESVPVNSFPPPFINGSNDSIDWLYTELHSEWMNWLPESASETVRRGAFYSVLLRPGFRIISLNMNYCNNLNFWLMLNSTDPVNELEWLIYELQSAEFADEKVHIIGHIPPGSVDCIKVWSRNYYKIINRYESIIIAQFFGHTHFDEFEVFYDIQNLTRPTSIAYVGPSVTPYDNLNPSYRIYYIDGDHDQTTRQVIDHETWIMNLKEANMYDDPIWYKLYSTRAAYGMTALRPIDWHELIQLMENNDGIFNLYYRYYWKDSHLRKSCDKSCKLGLICDAKSGRSHDRKFLCGYR